MGTSPSSFEDRQLQRPLEQGGGYERSISLPVTDQIRQHNCPIKITSIRNKSADQKLLSTNNSSTIKRRICQGTFNEPKTDGISSLNPQMIKLENKQNLIHSKPNNEQHLLKIDTRIRHVHISSHPKNIPSYREINEVKFNVNQDTVKSNDTTNPLNSLPLKFPQQYSPAHPIFLKAGQVQPLKDNYNNELQQSISNNKQTNIIAVDRIKLSKKKSHSDQVPHIRTSLLQLQSQRLPSVQDLNINKQNPPMINKCQLQESSDLLQSIMQFNVKENTAPLYNGSTFIHPNCIPTIQSVYQSNDSSSRCQIGKEDKVFSTLIEPPIQQFLNNQSSASVENSVLKRVPIKYLAKPIVQANSQPQTKNQITSLAKKPNIAPHYFTSTQIKQSNAPNLTEQIDSSQTESQNAKIENFSQEQESILSIQQQEKTEIKTACPSEIKNSKQDIDNSIVDSNEKQKRVSNEIDSQSAIVQNDNTQNFVSNVSSFIGEAKRAELNQDGHQNSPGKSNIVSPFLSEGILKNNQQESGTLYYSATDQQKNSCIKLHLHSGEQMLQLNYQKSPDSKLVGVRLDKLYLQNEYQDFHISYPMRQSSLNSLQAHSPMNIQYNFRNQEEEEVNDSVTKGEDNTSNKQQILQPMNCDQLNNKEIPTFPSCSEIEQINTAYFEEQISKNSALIGEESMQNGKSEEGMPRYNVNLPKKQLSVQITPAFSIEDKSHFLENLSQISFHLSKPEFHERLISSGTESQYSCCKGDLREINNQQRYSEENENKYQQFAALPEQQINFNRVESLSCSQNEQTVDFHTSTQQESQRFSTQLDSQNQSRLKSINDLKNISVHLNLTDLACSSTSSISEDYSEQQQEHLNVAEKRKQEINQSHEPQSIVQKNSLKCQMNFKKMPGIINNNQQSALIPKTINQAQTEKNVNLKNQPQQQINQHPSLDLTSFSSKIKIKSHELQNQTQEIKNSQKYAQSYALSQIRPQDNFNIENKILSQREINKQTRCYFPNQQQQQQACQQQYQQFLNFDENLRFETQMLTEEDKSNSEDTFSSLRGNYQESNDISSSIIQRANEAFRALSPVSRSHLTSSTQQGQPLLFKYDIKTESLVPVEIIQPKANSSQSKKCSCKEDKENRKNYHSIEKSSGSVSKTSSLKASRPESQSSDGKLPFQNILNFVRHSKNSSSPSKENRLNDSNRNQYSIQQSQQHAHKSSLNKESSFISTDYSSGQMMSFNLQRKPESPSQKPINEPFLQSNLYRLNIESERKKESNLYTNVLQQFSSLIDKQSKLNKINNEGVQCKKKLKKSQQNIKSTARSRK